MPSFLAPLAIDLLRLGIWLVLLMLIFGLAEKRWALHPQKLFRRAFGLDIAYFFLSGIIPKLLLILPITLLAATTHHLSPGGFYAWVAGLPMGIRILAALGVGEVGSYWGHRWSHELPVLWRFHALHHSAEEIDWLVNSRAHPVDMVFTRLCGLIPMYAVGLAQPMADRLDLVPLLATVLGTVWGFFIHANVRWRFGALEAVLSSPAFHHWHHTNDGPAQINKNYASMMPWVDRLFGTFYLPKEQWPTKYGIDTPTAPTLAGQLLQPLMTERIHN